ncbi:MAG: hypothetical protein ACM3KR_01275 [Deltaproteobacteria bacterium]
MLSELNNNKLFIFVGHFGSGKTETAVNFALEIKKHVDKVNVIDLDIVNPFFRTQDLEKELEEQGIKVISSSFTGTNVEMPSLPANISIVLQESESVTVLDIGGDDIGAKILSSYREYIISQSFELFCVINTFRPYTDTEEKIIRMIEYIQNSSRLKVSSLVNNANLSDETTIEDILESQKIIEKVSEKLNIPISFICVNEALAREAAKVFKQDIIVHKLRVGLPWV